MLEQDGDAEQECGRQQTSPKQRSDAEHHERQRQDVFVVAPDHRCRDHHQHQDPDLSSETVPIDAELRRQPSRGVEDHRAQREAVGTVHEPRAWMGDRNGEALDQAEELFDESHWDEQDRKERRIFEQRCRLIDVSERTVRHERGGSKGEPGVGHDPPPA